MVHDIILEGYGCRMRPVTLDDAEFMVYLRRQSHARGNIGDTPESVEKQKQWILDCFKKNDAYDWILTESETGRSVGAVALYNIRSGVAEPGRWVVLPDASFSIASTDMLLCRFAFEQLKLDRLIFNVVATNKKVLKFHRLFGATETHVEKNAKVINGSLVDFVWFEVTKEQWPELFAKWHPLIS
ncbi:MAG: GNAT family protein [Gallionella sp.]